MNEPQIPQFNGLARRKIGALLSNGYRVIGLAVGRERDGSRGLVTALGRVEWATMPAPTGGTAPDLSGVDTEVLVAELERRKRLAATPQ